VILREEYIRAQERAEELLARAGIPVLEEEIARIEAVDFGLSNLEVEGLQLLTMFETDRLAGRILIMTPNQTEPEHWHPPFGSDPGKQEIIRAFWGELRFYLPGESNMEKGFLVKGKEDVYTMRREVLLSPGQTLVLEPGTLHWFQAGEQGAVFYSYSTMIKDGADGFTDPHVVRKTVIVES
jgi:D-lyxose ketol-isomerase